MVAITALLPLLLVLAGDAEAAPSNRRTWGGRATRREIEARATPTTTRAAGDYQTFNTGLGSVFAPAVTYSNGLFYQSSLPYPDVYTALINSCNTQATNCLASSNVGLTDKLNCWGSQALACTNNAQTAANAYSASSAAQYSTSVAAYSASSSAAAYSSASAYSASSAAAYSSASGYSASSAAAYSKSSSNAAYSSSAAAYSSSSSAAAARTTSSAAASSTSKPSSSSAASSTSASASATTTAATATVSGNFQTFSGAIGAAVPAVTQASDGTWWQSGTSYSRLVDALSGSCYTQAGACAISSIADKSPCWGTQVNACLTAATSIANAYTSSAGVYSSSVASANLAKATMARTVTNDLQSYTGAIANIPAPAVTGSPQNWWMNGIYFYNLIDALSQSCYVQQGLCEVAATKANGAYEVTWNNCDNVQTPACLANAQQVVNNYGKSTSASATSTSASSSAASASSAANTASAASWSAQQSASAYSAQQSASAYSAQQSASAYSAQQSAAAYSAQQSAQAYSASTLAAQQSASAYSQSASAYSASSLAAQQSAQAYSSSTLAAQQSAAAYSQSASAYSASASAYSAQQSAAQASAVAYSASASAYSAQQAAAQTASAVAYSASAAAYSASAAAYSAQQSAAAWSSSSSAAAAQATAVPAGWVAASTACIAEGTSGRALISDSFTDSAMTWSKCTSYCSGKGYPLAGIEYSSECYCGNVLSNGASLNRPSSQCNMPASGNSQQIGGGPNALTLFVSSSLDMTKYTSDLSGMVQTLPSGWQSVTSGSGICVIEGTSGRALAAAMTASDNMTNAQCIAFCKGKGMQYAGTEYSRECYCGNTLVNGASLDRTAPCNMQCSGAPGTVCGGPGLLSVFQDTSYVYTATTVGSYSKQGCIQEVSGRALTGASTVTSDMTLEKCTAFCQAGGFAFAGLEYSSECYCGNTLSNGATLSAFSTQCTMPCSGNSGEICGGPNAITLYSTDAGLALVGA